jgi:hypothetical protein
MKRGVLNFRSCGLILVLISVFGLSAIAAFGQAIDGSVVGTIVDSQGAAVVGADVTAMNIATNVTANGKTSASGEYRFDHLLAGTYKITAKMTGFKITSENVIISLNQTVTRNLTLSPGAATETVEVSGVPPVIDTTTAQLQNTYDAKVLADSPLTSVGSGVINLSLMDAGVASSGGIGLGSGPSISGQRPRNNNYTVEGVDNNSKAVTGPLLQLPNDSVDSFTVLQNQFSPEFGHSSGGQFNQTIKSGTNSFHGRAYEYFQNRNLNAQDSQVALSQVSQGLKPFNTRYDNNRFGGQIGGPILKNKLFFFTNWEYNPVGGTTSTTGCAPTAAGYAALASMNSANITPGTDQNSANVPLSVSAVNLAQFQQYTGTAPTQATSADPNCSAFAAGFYTTPDLTKPLDPFSGTGPLVATGDIGYSGAQYSNFLTGVISLDWNISDKDQVRGRFAHEKNTAIDIAGQIPTFWTTTPTSYDLFTMSEYHTFTPNVSNEVRLGFNYNAQVFSAGNFSFPGLSTFPNLAIGFFEGNGIQIGPDGNAPQFGYQDFYQLVDNISWLKGHHNFKFGAEYREYISPQGFTQRVRGDYEYTTYWQYFTDQVPDYLAERSIGNSTYYGNQNMFYGYGNDDWHITKNITLNLGLRYEFTQVPLSQRKWQPLNSISNVPGLITFAAPTAQKTNFLPRVGFAWSPGTSGTTSVRGGFSMSQDVLYDNLGLLSAPPQVQQTCDATPTDQSAATGTCFWTDPTINTGTAASPAYTQPGFIAGTGLPFAATIPPITDPAVARGATSGYIPNQKLPYSETLTLGVQHIFANKYTVEVRYVGTRGIHLPVQMRLNRQDKTSATEFLPMYFTAPGQAALDALTTTYAQIDGNTSIVPAYDNAGFNGANVVGFMPYGTSKYNGLQTSLKRSLSNGLQFQAAWTWSHAMDNSTADVFSTYLTPRRPQNFQCFQCDWSDSALDRRNRITLEMLYDMPFLKHSDSWFMRNLVGNWQVTPSYTFQSPEYVTVQTGSDVNGNGDSAGDRTFINPAGIKGTGTGSTALTNTAGDVVAYVANSPTAYYVSAGKYSLPNARRNTLAMPHINDFDFSVLKRVNITETQSLEFQAQFLNFFNHAQYLPGYISDVAPIGYTGNNVLPMLEPTSSTFNKPQAIFTNHPRAAVLVLKYSF